MDYDIIIIGAGPGGYEMAAEASARYKMKTALIEKKELGGTCLNRGCIPTKSFLHSAGLYEDVKHKGEIFGITGTKEITADMEIIQSRKAETVRSLRDGISSLLKTAKVDVYEGVGTITDTGKVKVTSEDNTINITGKHIVIATGSKPDRQEELQGHDLEGVVTSDEILDLKEIPESMLIIGGGVIGMELASVFNALGTDVKIIKASSKIFNGLDKELGQSLKMLMKKRGVEIILGACIKEIRRVKEKLECVYDDSGTEDNADEKVITSEMILLAKGRKPETAGLISDDSSEAVRSLEIDNKGRVIVDENYRTSVEGIYAIGDCINGDNITGHAMLAHVAAAEGKNLLSYLNDTDEKKSMQAVPSCVYTEPEIAAVGPSPEECKEAGKEIIIKKYPMGANGRSVLTLQERGFIKIIAEAGSKKIIGASMMCARATDMISIFTQAIDNGLTTDDLEKVIYPHPTFCEGIGEALSR